MAAPDVLQDQLARLQGQLQDVTDWVAARQQELAGLQQDRQDLVKQIADLKAAYQAWKGVAL